MIESDNKSITEVCPEQFNLYKLALLQHKQHLMYHEEYIKNLVKNNEGSTSIPFSQTSSNNFSHVPIILNTNIVNNNFYNSNNINNRDLKNQYNLSLESKLVYNRVGDTDINEINSSYNKEINCNNSKENIVNNLDINNNPHYRNIIMNKYISNTSSISKNNTNMSNTYKGFDKLNDFNYQINNYNLENDMNSNYNTTINKSDKNQTQRPFNNSQGCNNYNNFNSYKNNNLNKKKRKNNENTYDANSIYNIVDKNLAKEKEKDSDNDIVNTFSNMSINKDNYLYDFKDSRKLNYTKNNCNLNDENTCHLNDYNTKNINLSNQRDVYNNYCNYNYTNEEQLPPKTTKIIPQFFVSPINKNIESQVDLKDRLFDNLNDNLFSTDINNFDNFTSDEKVKKEEDDENTNFNYYDKENDNDSLIECNFNQFYNSLFNAESENKS